MTAMDRILEAQASYLASHGALPARVRVGTAVNNASVREAEDLFAASGRLALVDVIAPNLVVPILVDDTLSPDAIVAEGPTP